MPTAVGPMEVAASTAVHTVPVVAADTTADFTVDIPAALMAAADPLLAHTALMEPGMADTAALATLCQHVHGRGKAAPLETFRPGGISSIPAAPETPLAPQPHPPGLLHFRPSVDLAAPQ